MDHHHHLHQWTILVQGEPHLHQTEDKEKERVEAEQQRVQGMGQLEESDLLGHSDLRNGHQDFQMEEWQHVEDSDRQLEEA